MSVPDTAKRKVVKPRWWEHAEPVVVYLDPVTRYGDDRRFDVYAADGERLGSIDEYEGRITTPLGSGSRLVHNGKQRTFWAVNGKDYWRYLPSQAEAIRKLLDDTQREP